MEEAPTNLREYLEAINNYQGCGGHSHDLINRIVQAAVDGDERVAIREEKPDLTATLYNERLRALGAELDRLDHWLPIITGNERWTREDYCYVVAEVLDAAEAYDRRPWTAEQIYDPQNWPGPPYDTDGPPRVDR